MTGHLPSGCQQLWRSGHEAESRRITGPDRGNAKGRGMPKTARQHEGHGGPRRRERCILHFAKTDCSGVFGRSPRRLRTLSGFRTGRPAAEEHCCTLQHLNLKVSKFEVEKGVSQNSCHIWQQHFVERTPIGLFLTRQNSFGACTIQVALKDFVFCDQ